MEDPNKWSVDKRVPIPSILAGAVLVIMQTAVLSAWISSLNYRVQTVEDFVKSAQPQAAQLAVMQEKVTTVQATLNKIETFITSLRNPPSHQ